MGKPRKVQANTEKQPVGCTPHLQNLVVLCQKIWCLPEFSLLSYEVDLNVMASSSVSRPCSVSVLSLSLSLRCRIHRVLGSVLAALARVFIFLKEKKRN